MTFGELFKLSHRESSAHRTRSRATIVTIGLLFGVLLAALLIAQGLENVTLQYAKGATGGEIYLASDYADAENDSLVRERIEKFDGKIIALSDKQKAEIDKTMPESAIIAKFTNLSKAYAYYSKTDAEVLHYNPTDYRISELFSNQIGVYGYFRSRVDGFVHSTSIVLVIVAIFILAFTLAHLIADNTKTFVLYRSIGASRGQLLLIYLVYLLELCTGAAVFAAALALSLAGIATAVCWGHLSRELGAAYPSAPAFWPILIGLNGRCFEVTLSIFLAAPISFLLCLDQFSNQKVAQKLKGD